MRHRGHVLVALAALGAILVPAMGRATDKQQGNMTLGAFGSPIPSLYDRDTCNSGFTPAPQSSAFVFGSSKAKYKFDGKCNGQILLSKLTDLPQDDGVPFTLDEVICLINFTGPFEPDTRCGTFVFGAGAKGPPGKQKVRIKFKGSDFPGGCPLEAFPLQVTSVECYEPDLAYLFDLGINCTATGGGLLLSPTIEGAVCLIGTAYLPNPATPVIAVQGMSPQHLPF